MSRLFGHGRVKARAASLMLALSLVAALPAVTVAAPPSNDNFANAKVIVGSLPYHDTMNTSEATAEGGEAESPCAGSTSSSVWYRFTPVRSGTFRVDTIGSNYDTEVDVFRGTTLAGLDLIDCNDDIDSNNEDLYDSRLAFRATGGVRYYIRVDGAGQLDLTLRSVRAPANDMFARARSIWSLPFDANADVINATSQLNEPRHDGNCSVMRATRWYKYTPQHTELVWVNTFVAADNDTVLAVYRGNNIDNLVEIACNDDQWVSNNRIYASGITFKALAGVTYRIQVGGYDAESGETRELPLHVRRLTAEPNDDFASAMDATADEFSDPVNMRRTSMEANEPDACADNPANSAWYRHTASGTDTLQASVSGSVDMVVAVWKQTGSGFGGLSLVDCAESVDFVPEDGSTYFFQVLTDEAETSPGEFELKTLL